MLPEAEFAPLPTLTPLIVASALSDAAVPFIVLENVDTPVTTIPEVLP